MRIHIFFTGGKRLRKKNSNAVPVQNVNAGSLMQISKYIYIYFS